MAVVHCDACLCIDERNAKTALVTQSGVVSGYILQSFFVHFSKKKSNDNLASSSTSNLSTLIFFDEEFKRGTLKEEIRHELGIFRFTRYHSASRHVV